ncbi:MAG TPA: hypothetical protein VMJ34_10810 [Bryobacteraceae bacterium]|nr:hypothetical protein [Bryobacteraceae bacterium]
MKPTRRARLLACLERHGWQTIGEREFQQLVAELAPASENDVRRLLRDTRLPLAPLVEGVRQTTPDDLERTLRALTVEYAAADAPRRQVIRHLALASRDHARLARKQEAVLWLQTWLENPGAFPLWVTLRRQAG